MGAMKRIAVGALISSALAVLPAAAHDGVVHATKKEAAAHATASGDAPSVAAPDAPVLDGLPFPVTVRAEFDLIDQTGETVTQADFADRHMLIFFGYANCPGICSVALPRMAATLDLLGDDADRLAPMLITIDPELDTPETLTENLPRIHPKLTGLTGSPDALAAARDAFGVQSELQFVDPEYGPIYAHGSFIYLIDGQGELVSLLPPVLGPEQMAEIIAKYLG